MAVSSIPDCEVWDETSNQQSRKPEYPVIDQEQYQQRLSGIRTRFIASLCDLQDDFRRLEDAISASVAQDGAISTLNYHAHRIRGIAPVLGLNKLGEIALETEELTMGMLDPTLPTGDIGDVVTALSRFRHEISRAVHA